MDVKLISKAMGSLVASLTEATESEMGVLILTRQEQIGVFVGGENNIDDDKAVIRMRRIAKHLNVLADNIASGKTKCDGTAYLLNSKGESKPLNDDGTETSSADGEISLLS